MNNTKKSILIYFDNFPMVTALPPEQRGWLLTVLMAFGARLCGDATVTLEQVMEQFPQLTAETRLACGFMGANIRRDTQRWLSRQRGREKSGPKQSAAPVSAAEQEQKAREDMERTRRLMEKWKTEG